MRQGFRRALTVALVCALAACSGGNGRKGEDPNAKVLHVGNTSEPLTLDPHRASGTWENHIIGDMFMGLVTEDTKAQPTPGMAASWTTSADGLVWTFKLRDATWSDGVPVTAQNFVDGFRRILNPKTAAQYASILYLIKNAEEVNSGKLPPETVGVKAVDDKTVEITLTHPAPYLPQLLMHYTTFPLPSHVYAKVGEKWIQPENVVTNGAFKLTEWKLGDYVHVKKNPKFWDASNVCLDEIYYYPTVDTNAAERRVKKGELDVNTDISSNRIAFLQKDPKMKDYVRVHNYLGIFYMVFNTNKKPFDDPRVREALSMAMDREFVTDKLLKGGQKPAYSFVPPGTAGLEGGATVKWAKWTMDQRRAEAKKLLAAAGYGPNNPLRFTLQHRNTADPRLIMPALQNDWKQIGVEAEITAIETQIAYDNLRARNFVVSDAAWIADFNDPYSFLYLLDSRTGPQNYGDYRQPIFDGFIDASNKEPDAAKRSTILRKAEQKILDDAAVAPLYYYVNKNLVSPKVTGWDDNLVDIHRERFVCFKK